MGVVHPAPFPTYPTNVAAAIPHTVDLHEKRRVGDAIEPDLQEHEGDEPAIDACSTCVRVKSRLCAAAHCIYVA